MKQPEQIADELLRDKPIFYIESGNAVYYDHAHDAIEEAMKLQREACYTAYMDTLDAHGNASYHEMGHIILHAGVIYEEA